MEYYIYITTNLINNKKYIGQHKGQINDSYLGSGTNILKAIKKYGKNNFKKEILKLCSTREEADAWEKYYIELYDAVNNDNFYNLQEGGSKGDGWRACHNWFEKHPEEAKKIYQQNGQRLQEWRYNHPEEFQKLVIASWIKGSKQWRENNPDKVKQIMEKVNLSKEEWQKTHPEEHLKQIEAWRKAGSEANSQPVICITTGEVFESQSAAARAYGIPQGNISKCLKGERKSAGKHPITKEKLFWKFAK